jgi:hypothetical protein
MKKIVKIGYIFLSILFLAYLSIPNYKFPAQIGNSIQSTEPADIETPFRRGYYVDYGRQEVLDFYQGEFENGIFGKVPLLTYRLNYPPEDAQTLIRDQTKSSYLEEIVHPFRESLFVNGFISTQDKDKMIVDGKAWHQKVILRLVTSSVYARLLSGILVVILLPVLVKGWILAFGDLCDQKEKIWNFRL